MQLQHLTEKITAAITDIETLRQEVARLTTENANLKAQLDKFASENDIIDKQQIADYLGITPRTLHAIIHNEKSFPKPFYLPNQRGTGASSRPKWHKADIVQWVANIKNGVETYATPKKPRTEISKSEFLNEF